MTDSAVVHLALQTAFLAVKLGAPILVTVLIVGFAVSLFQSVTQIQDSTLGFVPKLVAVAVVVLVSGHWMLLQITEFTHDLFAQLPGLLGHQ